ARQRAQALEQPRGQGAGGQGVGLERQMRAVRLGRCADRNHDQRAGLETRLGLEPGKVFQPDAGVAGHAATLAWGPTNEEKLMRKTVLVFAFLIGGLPAYAADPEANKKVVLDFYEQGLNQKDFGGGE